jgi:hypothetical protein
LRRVVNAVRSKVQRGSGSNRATFANDDDGVRYLLAAEYTPDMRNAKRFSLLHAVPVAFGG